MSRLKFGMVQQPWFIGTVIGTVGGALWFALCVFSLWLCRRRQRRRKYPRSNGVVSGKIQKFGSVHFCLFVRGFQLVFLSMVSSHYQSNDATHL